MTVKELRELLNGFDDDMLVLKTDADYIPPVVRLDSTKVLKVPNQITKKKKHYMEARRWYGKNYDNLIEKEPTIEYSLIDAVIIK